jgi:hypothetical protein
VIMNLRFLCYELNVRQLFSDRTLLAGPVRFQLDCSIPLCIVTVIEAVCIVVFEAVCVSINLCTC